MSELSRVTLVLPKALWEKVKHLVPSGQRSRLVAEALEVEIRRRQRLEQADKLCQFHEYMRSKYGDLPATAEEIEAMRQEHDDAIDSVH